MKIVAAQIRPVTGDLEANVCRHISVIESAAAQGADLVLFPELSLTGYEPTLARALATLPNDGRWDVFQSQSDRSGMVIGVGAPILAADGVRIGLLVFQPGAPRQVYSKQLLHPDELPYFVPGTAQLILNLRSFKLAPAICYESVQPEHAAAAADLGASIYLASVAKPARNMARAQEHYPAIARQYSLTVVMANSVGPADDFVAAGQSAWWDARGDRQATLRSDEEGLLSVEIDLSS